MDGAPEQFSITTSFTMSVSQPQQAAQAASVLSSMGVTSCEPRVLNQLLEFMYRESEAILKRARRYASARPDARRVEPSDVRLAISARAIHHFDQRATLEATRNKARDINSIPLPGPPQSNSSIAVARIPLPPERERMKPRAKVQKTEKKEEEAEGGENSAMDIDVERSGNFNKRKADKQIPINIKR